MIIQCNSCSKKFVVPDSAIKAKGRLVQCSSCGNKWTQYPEINQEIVKISPKKKELNIKETSITKKKKIKKKKIIPTYSTEYLQNKHGIKIIDPSSQKIKENFKNKKKSKSSLGFYGYTIIFIIFFIFLIGLLNFTKEIIIYNFPFLETYIQYLYETINNIKLIILDMFVGY